MNRAPYVIALVFAVTLSLSFAIKSAGGPLAPEAVLEKGGVSVGLG